MKNIHTLIPDIYKMLPKKDGWFTDQIASQLADDIVRRLKTNFNEPATPPTLRLSRMGPMCPRALWCSIHKPEEAEELPPWAHMKYSFGHIEEAKALALARASGHSVEGEQDEVHVDGVKGHRDCVLDGCIVDVKSVHSRYLSKLKNASVDEMDAFGYLSQLDGYLLGSHADPLVTVKDRAYLWLIDRQMGHMRLYEHRLREDHIRRRVAESKRVVGLDSPPPCTCGTVAEGASGNRRLDTKASYSQFKYFCFPDLRTFIYANGPVYLTKVARKPEVIEVDRYGKTVQTY